MGKNFQITYEWLLQNNIAANDLYSYKSHFRNNANVLEVLQHFSNKNGIFFAIWLADRLPFNTVDLDIKDFQDNYLVYNGNVNVKGDIDLSVLDRIYVKGNLNINGNLYLKDTVYVYAKEIKAKKVFMDLGSKVIGNIKAQRVSMGQFCAIYGSVEVTKLDMNDSESRIIGNLIYKDVKAKQIRLNSDSNILGRATAKQIYVRSNNNKKSFKNFYADRVVYF